MSKELNLTVGLPVMESFYTLQGEGFHTGKAAFFIRLAGCDVGCHWCDVKESWTAQDSQFQEISQITEKVLAVPSKTAVITGGEPAMYNLSALVDSLHKSNISVHIETSGVHPIIGDLDWITLSPKKFKDCLPENFSKANELKIVIFHPADLEWAEKLAQNVKKDCKLYLQPEWGKADKITPLIINHIQSNPKWRLSLQTHKYINIP
ncbi:MAG: radical SAM protein [Cyclobacteriaceae bacterium]|nr:radical SAM protein [Cyclobacteriaceae bacterium]